MLWSHFSILRVLKLNMIAQCVLSGELPLAGNTLVDGGNVTTLVVAPLIVACSTLPILILELLLHATIIVVLHSLITLRLGASASV